ncbi:MAG: tetratricopeptide repeat protein, partial [Bacteroidota bacterium]
KIIKKQIKIKPNDVMLYHNFGKLLESQFKDDEANEWYAKAIQKLRPDQGQINKLANAFMTQTKYDLAAATFEEGSKLLKNKSVFAYSLGNLYRQKGDTEKMIQYYLNSLDQNPARMSSLKTLFERYLNKEDFTILKSELYNRIQEDENALHFPEMLSWVFIYSKDYNGALRQARALDKRHKENGQRVFDVAQIAHNAKDYDTAIKGFEYIVENKGKTSSYYLQSKQESLNCKRKKLTANFNHTQEELQDLENEYNSFVNEFGRNKMTAPIMVQLAKFQAYYLNDMPKAIDLLNEVIAFPNVNRYVKANAKLDLGDFNLIVGEIWEASLLYSQVDKEFAEDLLGQNARFRNAKLSYYAGDFQWAQTQFNVLKASTSKLIANDALDLSVFIMDNLGLDTTDRSLGLYAEADLLTFQNRHDDAFNTLDQLLKEFPDHSLQDDVLYSKALIFKKIKDYNKAAELFQQIVDNYPEEIRADNSLFELASLYENELGDKTKAQELYEKLFIDFSGSTFSIEARKRFRILRGDFEEI